MRWRASRARGHTWLPTVFKTLRSIHDPDITKKLHISVSQGGENVDISDIPEHESEIMNKFTNLCIEISAARCWSQCQYILCLPNQFASVHHADVSERQRGMMITKTIWTAMLNAERVLADPTTDAGLRRSLEEIMKDSAWQKSQIARELYLVCEAGGWNHEDQQTRQLGFYLFGTPGNTKHFLEDTFSHLADIAKRAIRNFKLTKNLNCKTFFSGCFSHSVCLFCERM